MQTPSATTDATVATQTALLKAYQQFRLSGGTIVGENAKQALSSAKTLLRFRELESDGLVRLRAEEERENYFDVYGKPDTEKEIKAIERILERDGCWCSIAEWFDGEDWNLCDSVGMHMGYREVLSPFENSHIVDLMRAAVDAAENHMADYAI